MFARKDSVGFFFLYPAALIYFELLFNLFTVGDLLRLGHIAAVLFCLCLGCACYLICTIPNRRTGSYCLTLIFLFLTALPFLIESFVYKEFKIFYDLNTTFAGATDAVTGFSSDIFGLIFSASGLLRIALFLLPFVLYLIFGRRITPAYVSAYRRVLTLIWMVLLFFAGWGVVRFVPSMWRVYKTEYHFQEAVEEFGLLTGIRLDAREMLFGSSEFETLDPAPVQPVEPTVTPEPEENPEPEPEEEPEPEPEPIVYAPNQMDLPLDDPDAGGVNAQLNEYIAGLTPTMQNAYTGIFKGKNLIFISAEAFSAEVIDPDLTPTLYRLATKGINFTDYYQPAGAGTTGGEYQNIFGLLPTSGGRSFKETASYNNYFTMGSQLNRLGYYGKAFHNNDYTYYDRDKTHVNLGYSDGFMGYGNGMEEYVQSQWPQSDYEMIAGTLDTYIDRQPFNIYYMSVSGHSGYSQAANAMSRKHWARVQGLPYSDAVKGYLAANLDLEDALTYLVNKLEQAGIADDTVICISADHFPYGLDNDAALGNMPYLSELYGYPVEDSFQRDHSRLILWCGSLEQSDPIVVSSPTSSLDILPTLSNLFGTEFDSRLMCGRDVFSDAPALVFDLSYNWKTDCGTYYASSGTFVPVTEDTVVADDYVEYMKSVVRNKINYCKSMLETDYFGYLFPTPEPEE